MQQNLQYLRIGKARESLEFWISTVNEISWMVGYEDPGSFRKVFSADHAFSAAGRSGLSE
jgi:transcriptional regulator GlxA family with amidase domain